MQKSCQFLLPMAAILSWLGFAGDPASAQVPNLQLPNPPAHDLFLSPNDLNRHHTSPFGKRCLTIEGSAKSQVLNPHIFEHWVSATNICGQDIKLQVCYAKSQDCIILDVPPWGRKDAVLGIYPALPDFRFEAKEQF